jgi:hypothetical protein
MNNPFEPNITFSIIEETTNPFEPVEYGEGGFNSGVKLENYIKDPNFASEAQRKKKHNLNSQRLYRQRNRKEYNENMLELWKQNRGTDVDDKGHFIGNKSYETWKSNQAIANKNYRFKKMIEEPSENAIAKYLKKEFNSNVKRKVGRRKKGEKSYEDKRKEYVGDSANIENAKNALRAEYKKDYQKFLDSHPNHKLSNKPVYTVGEYQYKQYDPKGLELGTKTVRPNQNWTPSENKQYNLGELQTYYNSVLTDIAPSDSLIKTHQPQSRYYPNLKLPDYASKRNKHARIFEKEGDDYRVNIEKTADRIKVKDKDTVKKIPQGKKNKKD